MPVTKVSKNSVRYPSENEAFWSAHATALKSSDLSRKAYCQQYQINYDRFAYWLHKKAQSTSSLVAVKIKETQKPLAQNILCTLRLNNGNQLAIHDQQALAFILERLS